MNQALVPTMTSYNTPEGEVLYWPNDIPVQSGYPFWKAFDGDLSTRGASSRDVNGTGRLETGLGYHFTKPVKPTSFQFTWGDGNKSNYTFTIKAQGSNDGENWIDLSEEYTIQMKLTTTDFALTANETYTYLRILYVGYSCPTNIGYPQASEIQFYGDPNPPKPHIKSTGSTEAIRDWLNASLYNKEEIDNLFIQNNQSGLIPYDLTVEGYEPEQMIKLVGQTSGKVYNLCLAALMAPVPDWFTDSDFYVDDTNAAFRLDDRDFYKTVAGPAYCCGVRINLSQGGFSPGLYPMFVSRDDDYVKYTTSFGGGPFEKLANFRYRGDVWAVAGGYYGYSPADPSMVNTLPFTPVGPYNNGWSDVAKEFLDYIYESGL